jgi:hypothetical protein
LRLEEWTTAFLLSLRSSTILKVERCSSTFHSSSEARVESVAVWIR